MWERRACATFFILLLHEKKAPEGILFCFFAAQTCVASYRKRKREISGEKMTSKIVGKEKKAGEKKHPLSSWHFFFFKSCRHPKLGRREEVRSRNRHAGIRIFEKKKKKTKNDVFHPRAAAPKVLRGNKLCVEGRRRRRRRDMTSPNLTLRDCRDGRTEHVRILFEQAHVLHKSCP